MRTFVELDKLAPLVEGREENPFAILGPHEVVDAGRRALSVRAFLPESDKAWVVDPTHAWTRPMQRIHPAGLYEAICPLNDDSRRDTYMLRTTNQRGQQTTTHDPYAFEPLLTGYDLHLLGEGRHWKSYSRMGAQLRTIDGVEGVNFKNVLFVPHVVGGSASLRPHIVLG